MRVDSYLDVALDAADGASKVVLDYFRNGFEVELKKDGSKVTEADLAANEFICGKLYDYPIISEEKLPPKERFTSDYVWLVDPIDGTSKFSDKNGRFAIHIGLAYKGEPVLGVVKFPFLDQTLYALKGDGAFSVYDGVEEKLNVPKKLYSPEGMRIDLNSGSEDLSSLNELLSKNDSLVSSGSFHPSRVATGEVNAHVYDGSRAGEWDFCAPHIIIEEAGGKVTDFEGNDVLYNREDVHVHRSIVMSDGRFHDSILGALKR